MKDGVGEVDVVDDDDDDGVADSVAVTDCVTELVELAARTANGSKSVTRMASIGDGLVVPRVFALILRIVQGKSNTAISNHPWCLLALKKTVVSSPEDVVSVNGSCCSMETVCGLWISMLYNPR